MGTASHSASTEQHSRPRREPFLLGLAGGIGSGKSLVASQFAELGCMVIDFDHEVGLVLELPEVIETLRSWWGDRVVGGDGNLDREAVSAIVFDDSEQRRRLEALVHPLVWRTAAQVRSEAPPGTPAVIFDAPVLFEAGLDAECDAVALVDAPRDLRLERVQRDRGWSEQEFARREGAQMGIDDKKGRCRFIIRNDGNPEETMRQVRDVFAIIRRGDRADEV